MFAFSAGTPTAVNAGKRDQGAAAGERVDGARGECGEPDDAEIDRAEAHADSSPAQPGTDSRGGPGPRRRAGGP